MFDPADPDPDYELVWPRELFRSEAAVLGRQLLEPDYVPQIELLLEEAFAGRSPVDDFRDAVANPLAHYMITPGQFLDGLLQHLEDMPEHTPPRPYWSARHGRGPAASPTMADALRERQLRLQHEWAGLVEDLRMRGYLDRAAPRGCVDDPTTDQDVVLDRATADRIGVEGLWPPRVEVMTSPKDADMFFSLVEVVHDLVARPRHRRWHEASGCGWHYSRFAPAPGRALYRWHVDRLLTRHGVPLRLAATGEDAGRLVRKADEEHGEIVDRILAAGPDRDTRQHAVALFRGRDAGVPEKRSAIVAVAGLLEDRRSLLKTELLRPDEGALFNIANNFDLRHRRADQRGDYDEAFLDWLYWWYLATLDLTDRLLARQADDAVADPA